MATYSFDNREIGKQLVNQSGKGIDIKIMIEGFPVGGLDENVISFIGNDIPVYLNKNNHYHYHHAKYAIFDNKTVLISTENFNSKNRGWFAVIRDREVANYFLNLFFNDIKSSEVYKSTYKKSKGSGSHSKLTKYKPIFGKGYCYNSTIEVFTAPDATEEIIKFLNESQGRLWIEQFYIYRNWSSRINPFLEVLVDKNNKLDVRVLMDSTWYVTRKDNPNSNFNTQKYLQSKNVSSKLLDREKTSLLRVHTKGALDKDSVLVSSINWNEHSPTKNREIGLVIHCVNASNYFSNVFEYDWNGKKEKYGFIQIFLQKLLCFFHMNYLS